MMSLRAPLVVLVALLTAAPAFAQFGSGPRRIADGETLQGTLTASDPRLDDGSHYDLYVYRGAAGETVTFTMRSADFDAYLIGPDVTNDDGAGGTDAELTLTLDASGEVQLRANSISAGATGRYSLQAASISGGTGQIVGRLIQSGETLRGTLEASDPTLSDGSHVDLYTYRGTPGETVTFTMRSTAFDAYMTVGQVTDGTFAPEANDDDGAGGTDAQLVLSVGPSGQFVVQANSVRGGATGAYTLFAEASGGPGPLASGDAQPISAGTPVRADLSDADPRLRDNSAYDLYVYEGAAGEAIEVFLASVDFDAYLMGGATPEAALSASTTNDDDGGGTNARLRVETGTDGRYYIVANAYAPESRGGYTLSIRSVGGGAAPSGLAMISMGETVQGQLDVSDPTLSSDGTHFDVYGYQGRAGEEIVVTLTSDDFDPYLLLSRYFGDEVEAVSQDDDNGPGLGSRVRVTLAQSGTYLAIANSVGAGATGRYALTIQRPEDVTDMEDAAEGFATLDIGTPARGVLEAGDRQLADESYADLYVLRGAPGETVAVTMRSADFDAYLGVSSLEGGELTSIGQDDDGAGGSDARVEFTLGGAGIYAIQANSYAAGATGAYTLTAERVASGETTRPGTMTTTSNARFTGKWAPLQYTETGDYAEIREAVAAERRLETVAERLNSRYPLPTNVPVSFKECTEPGATRPNANAFYNPNAGEIVFCYELMDDLITQFSAGLAPEQVDEAVTGAYDFIILHEVGHALTHQLDLPITGREEDVADQFATLALLRQGDKGATAALNGVSYLYGSGGNTFGRRSLADEHSLGPQRLFNVQCWILGSDLEKYAWLVLDSETGEEREDDYALTIDRARRCTGEYTQMEKSFTRLLDLAYGN
ncbi:DUF4344 domain-containing metallopeptidase [Rubricoccus marinus]|uniref:Peptidase C-terminal archaeal/bacterial domain-containing protein n=1 Tax=Rubricoccus marinus TaxID=716817 RepID=A0A259TWE2_9BACT|nr:DUF4344 domain-containing metallopeptidase [Rubricoccus marinus]OZC02089.1 hypothetical protein BSZ36_03275 [Rubricoccus marinus]